MVLLFFCIDGETNFAIVKEHIKQQGSVDVLSLKSYLIGPSRVGKTTTRRRLTGEIDYLSPDEIVPSTGIDAPLTVQLYHDTEQSSVLISEGWTCQGLSEQCRAICNCILNTQSSKADSTGQKNATMGKSGEKSEKSSVKSFPATSALQLKSKASSTSEASVDFSAETESSDSDSSSELSVDTTTQSRPDPEDEITSALRLLIEEKDWNTIRKVLKSDKFTLLHIVDIGGQPEFHEILPLLLHGHALNLIFLDMTKDLDSLYTVIYSDHSGSSPLQYQSEFTIKEIIQRALHSITLLQSNTDYSQLAAILVGTHLDKCSEANILTLERSIRDNFSNFIEDSILCSSSKQGEKYIYLVNNVSGDSSDIKGLRELIETTVHNRFNPKKVPTATLLLHLILRLKFDPSPGWCSLEECISIAEHCGISREDLTKEGGILQYLHDSFGTILHYRGLKIGLRVIVNTNLITHPPAELFATAFGTNESERETAEKMRRTGEIPHRLMTKVCSSKNYQSAVDEIPTDEIVELLTSRYILYEHVQLENEKRFYFLPCLLYPDHKVNEQSQDPVFLDSLTYPPILLIPETGFVPLGPFPATVVKLSQSSHWTLAKRPRFRNHIRFFFQLPTEQVLDVELRSLSTHLEFSISCEPINPCLIPECLHELRECFDEVLSFYPHTKRLKWDFGFYCPHAIQSRRSPHPACCKTKDKPQSVICSLEGCKDGPINLQDKHKCWFTVSECIK